MPYIYKITNQLNNKVYIGKTLNTIEHRWKEHCADYTKERNEKRPLYEAMKKYGIENFVISEIEECSDQIINDREVYWIEYYGSFKNGYNATRGGDGKAYLDYDLIVANYQQLQNIQAVADLMNINRDSVAKVLKLRNIQIKTSGQVLSEKNGKMVQMFDKKTKTFIRTFPTMMDAAKWLIDNNYTNCKNTTIRYHISEVCQGKRKSAAGFIWKYYN